MSENVTSINYDTLTHESESERDCLSKLKDFATSITGSHVHCKCVNISKTVQARDAVTTDD